MSSQAGTAMTPEDADRLRQDAGRIIAESEQAERKAEPVARRGWQSERRGTEKGGLCPACQHRLSRVYDGEGGERCRECARPGCGARWVTEEVFKRRIA